MILSHTYVNIANMEVRSVVGVFLLNCDLISWEKTQIVSSICTVAVLIQANALQDFSFKIMEKTSVNCEPFYHVTVLRSAALT